MAVDVTRQVEFDNPDDECLPLLKCVCGYRAKAWEWIISIYDDSLLEPCPKCGRRFYFKQGITIYEVQKAVTPKRFEFAEQYNIVCVIIHPGDTADEIIKLASENDATYFDGEDECYCVRFPDRPQELFTAEALQRSIFPTGQGGIYVE